jgi:hypothetical protein
MEWQTEGIIGWFAKNVILEPKTGIEQQKQLMNGTKWLNDNNILYID